MNFEQKKIEINGVEYTLQKMPIRSAMTMRLRWQSNGYVDDVVMCDELFKNVVVNPPKVLLDEFEYIEDAEALADACLNFQFKGKDAQKK